VAKRRVGEWCVGDVVLVKEHGVVTNLGEGHIIDIRAQPNTNVAIAALVRFEHGPADGVWYTVSNLRQVRDIDGVPIHSGKLCPPPPAEERVRGQGGRNYAVYVGVPMSEQRITALRAQANSSSFDPYEDAQAIHECLDVIVALQNNWCPPGKPKRKTEVKPPPKPPLFSHLYDEEEDEDEDEDEDHGEPVPEGEGEATASSTVVRCVCRTKGPVLCPRHQDEECDTTNCDGTAATLCECGTKACPTCMLSIHCHCFPGMS